MQQDDLAYLQFTDRAIFGIYALAVDRDGVSEMKPPPAESIPLLPADEVDTPMVFRLKHENLLQNLINF
ncbi:hypothetical protein HY504_00770 [Candidatus Wolfebacteria bacterium]|nr:hypothetical protein [Candidatus Wolfebacteria bacterium]